MMITVYDLMKTKLTWKTEKKIRKASKINAKI